MMKYTAIVLMNLALNLALSPPTHAQSAKVGSLEFPTSGSPEAQELFLRGVAILHSFGWNQAIEQFQAAQRLDPDFAMAYWGETLCYNHPLFAIAPDDDNPEPSCAVWVPRARNGWLRHQPTVRRVFSRRWKPSGVTVITMTAALPTWSPWVACMTATRMILRWPRSMRSPC